jgi:hypothetical protein
MTWEELKLIQADYRLHVANDLSGAIDLVNEIRADKNLPVIQGAYRTTVESDAEYVRAVLLEERRRELFAEGARYWSTKIQNTDVLWFPRNRGQTPAQGYNTVGGVRMLFAGGEYEGNTVWRDQGGEALQGTGCASLGSLGGGPGSQAPVLN